MEKGKIIVQHHLLLEKQPRIKSMAEAFRKADRALVFCESVESNEFEPCKLFKTSCSRLKEKNSEVSVQCSMPSTSTMPGSLQWGLDNETNVHEKYLEYLGKKENVEIKNIGLVVSLKWPFLGCSPDGIVLEHGVSIACIKIKMAMFQKRIQCLQMLQRGTKHFS